MPVRSTSLRWEKRQWLGVAALLMILITASAGVIAALGDTLFPNATMSADFSAGSHFLIRLRVLHPALALAMTIVLAVFVSTAARVDARAKKFAGLGGAAGVTQLFLGMMNIALQAPVWLQMLHLGVADVVWIAKVLVMAKSLLTREPAA
jgi:heme A synthase